MAHAGHVLWVTAALRAAGGAVEAGVDGRIDPWSVLTVAFACQIGWQQRQLGAFRWWTIPTYPLLLIAFIAIYLYSAYRLHIRRSVVWQGRGPATGSIVGTGPVIDDDTTAALVSAAAWAVIGVVTGFMMHRMPTAWLTADRLLTRPAGWETRRFYRDRLRIHRWKDRLPEAGAFFAGGFAKRRIVDRSTEHLTRWAIETRRAEYTHWLNIAAGPLFFLWCPPRLVVIMVLFALGAHLPFIAVQRHNRLRLRAARERSRDQVDTKV